MAAPVWTTPPGDLGTIVEAEFYQIRLEASDATSYEFHSGELPNGIEIKRNGNVEGYPRTQNYIQGAPAPVRTDVTSRFVVRARSDDNKVADRVFQLTVTGPDAPVIETLPGSDLGSYFDGDYVHVQLTATDEDPADTLTWKYQGGDLPIGLTVDKNGLISGYIEPFIGNKDGTPGFDAEAYDINSFDYRTVSENKYYEFTVEVTDGVFIATKDYRIFVASRNNVSTDTDLFTADIYGPTASVGSLAPRVTADATNLRTPVLLTRPADLGIVKHDNRYNFQFVGRDFDADPIEYEISLGSALGFDNDNGFDSETRGFDQGEGKLPPGLFLDPNSGWLHGTIPAQAATKIDYQFSIRVKKKNNPAYMSRWVPFTFTIEGDIDTTVKWPNKDLGIIQTGDISELDVKATIADGRQVLYELKQGYDQRIPQGLQLTSKGLLVGRAAFETFMLDTGKTTFEVSDVRSNETTFEKKYKFTVRAYSNDGVIDTYETFTLTLQPSTNEPYESLFAKALPDQSSRNLFDTLLNNSDDIPVEDLYRGDDWYFGIQNDIRILVAAGLKSRPESDFISTIARNHHNNTLCFGNFNTARATNADGTTKYEVIYAEITDKGMGVNPTTKLPAPAAQEIDLRLNKGFVNPITVDEVTGNSTGINIDSSLIDASMANDYRAFPNAIENMRVQLKTKLDQVVLERYVLPDWMQDKQEDNTIIGWKLAVPLVYCKPGKSKRIKYNLEQKQVDFKKIGFTVDRFILDNNLSKWFDKTTRKYKATRETTFDLIDLGPGKNSLKNINPVATVEYIIDSISYDRLKWSDAALKVSQNLIPGLTDIATIPATGVDVIWRIHSGLNAPNDGWNEYAKSVLYGQVFDGDGSGLESSTKINGYEEKIVQGNPVVNQRAGVWTLTVDSDGLFDINFKKEVNPGEVVRVNYQNSSYYYQSVPTGGNLVPEYKRVDANAEGVDLATNPTRFDGNGTRFFADIDVYSDLDEGDKYIKFPKVGVFK